MAAEWIKIRTALLNELEVMHLARVLKVTKHDVVGRLVALWSWASGVTEDGTLPGCTFADIDAVVEKRGFAAALAAIPGRATDAQGEHTGWLVEIERGLVLPNFDRHNGSSGKARAQAAMRQARQRGRVTPGSPGTPGTCVTPVSRSERDDSVTVSVTDDAHGVTGGVTLASRDRHAASVTRKEKRREEKNVIAGAMTKTPQPPADAGGRGPTPESSSSSRSGRVASGEMASGTEAGAGGAGAEPLRSKAVWNGCFSNVDAQRLIDLWNSTPGGVKASGYDVNVLRAVYDAASVADDLTPEQRCDPVAWLHGRLEAYIRSHQATVGGGKFKGRLLRWLSPKDGMPCRAFEPDEAWAALLVGQVAVAVEDDTDALIAEGYRRREAAKGGAL